MANHKALRLWGSFAVAAAVCVAASPARGLRHASAPSGPLLGDFWATQGFSAPQTRLVRIPANPNKKIRRSARSGVVMRNGAMRL